jgi:two-component system, NarL family, nitrate/nitrite response regulator NarL
LLLDTLEEDAMTLRLALVEHHELFADSLDIALTMNGHTVARIGIPDGGGTVDGLVSRILAARPDVAVLDLDLPVPGDPAEAIRPLTAAGVHVVALTSSGAKARWGQCLGLGARRVVPKTASLQAVMGTLRRIENGLPVVPADHRRALISVWHRERSTRDDSRRQLATLTRREQEVLAHLFAGRSVREIARTDVVSEATVRTQVKAILSKLDVGSQLAAVGRARQAGWRPPQPAPPEPVLV